MGAGMAWCSQNVLWQAENLNSLRITLCDSRVAIRDADGFGRLAFAGVPRRIGYLSWQIALSA